MSRKEEKSRHSAGGPPVQVMECDPHLDAAEKPKRLLIGQVRELISSEEKFQDQLLTLINLLKKYKKDIEFHKTGYFFLNTPRKKEKYHDININQIIEILTRLSERLKFFYVPDHKENIFGSPNLQQIHDFLQAFFNALQTKGELAIRYIDFYLFSNLYENFYALLSKINKEDKDEKEIGETIAVAVQRFQKYHLFFSEIIARSDEIKGGEKIHHIAKQCLKKLYVEDQKINAGHLDEDHKDVRNLERTTNALDKERLLVFLYNPRSKEKILKLMNDVLGKLENLTKKYHPTSYVRTKADLKNLIDNHEKFYKIFLRSKTLPKIREALKACNEILRKSDMLPKHLTANLKRLSPEITVKFPLNNDKTIDKDKAIDHAFELRTAIFSEKESKEKKEGKEVKQNIGIVELAKNVEKFYWSYIEKLGTSNSRAKLEVHKKIQPHFALRDEKLVINVKKPGRMPGKEREIKMKKQEFDKLVLVWKIHGYKNEDFSEANKLANELVKMIYAYLKTLNPETAINSYHFLQPSPKFDLEREQKILEFYPKLS